MQQLPLCSYPFLMLPFPRCSYPFPMQQLPLCSYPFLMLPFPRQQPLQRRPLHPRRSPVPQSARRSRHCPALPPPPTYQLGRRFPHGLRLTQQAQRWAPHRKQARIQALRQGQRQRHLLPLLLSAILFLFLSAPAGPVPPAGVPLLTSAAHLQRWNLLGSD